jgi:MazG family protein
LSAGDKFQRLTEIMARLRSPGGCPWDREQTFDTIKPYLLEETYEVLDAIDARDWRALAEELGDLLLETVFFAQMAAERNLFAIEDSLDSINEKLVRRHPHVFGSGTAKTPGEV